ncbi:hypothetical protein ACJMK2_014583 [Sinanodonta woodiana]|uniref:ATP-grasp domain-containing protein n=1 Tax=Sinanodonta woodiana TaxID=1069815 RepID=A0ABD3V1G7_SINWO
MFGKIYKYRNSLRSCLFCNKPIIFLLLRIVLGMDVFESDNNLSPVPEVDVTVVKTNGYYLPESRPCEQRLITIEGGTAIPQEDAGVLNYYNILKNMLQETGYPETLDRTNQPKSTTLEDISICILSSPAECMAILLEGGKRCPGDMLLVLSSTWLSKKNSKSHKGLYSLYVHKAIAFGVAGQTFLETYIPPRRATYFMNFCNNVSALGQIEGVKEIEDNLDCPTSSSINLRRMTSDILWTRHLMSKIGLDFPETVGFVFGTYEAYSNDVTAIRVVHIDNKKTDLENIVNSEVTKFLQNKVAMVVLKTSGMMWQNKGSLTLHCSNDNEGIIKKVLELFAWINHGDAVLLETFIGTIKPAMVANGPKWSCTENSTIRMRSIVCRNHVDTPVTTNLTCGIALVRDPFKEDDTICQPLNVTLIGYGVTDEAERERFEKVVREKSADVLNSIMTYESELNTLERGGLLAQTDVIGIDFVITRRNGVLIPVGIAVNSHNCIAKCKIFENLYPKMKGVSVRPLVETMITRSQKFIMVGKNILVVGAGGYSRQFIWKAAEKMGIQVVLVDSDPNHSAKNEVVEFIHVNFSDHTQDQQHAMTISKHIKDSQIKVDGCLTFVEDYVPLTAMCCELLNLPGATKVGALRAKHKSATLAILRERTADLPNWPKTCLYTSWFSPLRSQDDIEYVKKVGRFPLIMKLEYGFCAVGVTLVRNSEEMEDKYKEIRAILQKPEDFIGIGLGHGNTMMAMEYLVGTEHDVDVIFHEGQLVAAFISDNGPTRGKTYTETTACMPSVLPYEKQRQLIVAAYQCCREIGLKNGVFNVEFMMEQTGPKLVEINGRMGGLYLRDWIRKVYGTDLLLSAFEIACGIKPYVPDTIPMGQMMGIMCIPSLHNHILKDPAYASKWKQLEATCNFNLFEKHADVGAGGFEFPFANIAVMEKDLPTARQKLMAIAKDMNIVHPEYDVERFLSDFQRT